LAFSPDGGRLVWQGIDDEDLHLWDARTGKPIRRLRQGTGGCYFLAYSPREERIASVVTGRLSLWDADSGQELYQKPLSGHDVTSPPDGLVIAVYGESIHLLEAATGAELTWIPCRVHHGGWWSLAFSPDGRYLAVTERNDVGVWDVLAGRFVHTF